MGQIRITREKREEIIVLRAQGHSYSKIAEMAGVAKGTAVEECRRAGDAVMALRGIEEEALFEEYKLGAMQRARERAELLQRLRTEIEGRDLSDIPTAKLVEMYLKQLSDFPDTANREIEEAHQYRPSNWAADSSKGIVYDFAD